ILDHNDMITVPHLPGLSERIYVFGEVVNEGVYPFSNTMNLLTAIGQAGGCSRTAVRSSIKIIRGYAENKPIVLGADLDLLLKGGDIRQNIELHDGDVVYVPRTFIGNLNEFILKTTPMLEYIFYPGRIRDTYANPDTLRVLTR
ncbi:MAG: SLBB domain-containing protein, partial [Desulfobulbaceae bacterium]|nr:SLBB domain-containing protein [Desulfobulbaceae bacterium]